MIRFLLWAGLVAAGYFLGREDGTRSGVAQRERTFDVAFGRCIQSEIQWDPETKVIAAGSLCRNRAINAVRAWEDGR